VRDDRGLRDQSLERLSHHRQGPAGMSLGSRKSLREIADPKQPRSAPAPVSTKRWLSPDPLGGDVFDPQSLNRYAYTLNNPMRFIDPLGLDCEDPEDPSPCVDIGITTITVTAQAPPAIPLQLYDTAYHAGGFNVGAGKYLPPSFYPCAFFGYCGGAASNKPTPPSQPQTPKQAATQSCREHGQYSFDIPFTHIPVTISLSTTLAFVNYSLTQDQSVVVPTSPPWLSFGGSIDVTVNAPAEPTPSVNIGAGKNMSAGTFVTPGGLQGLTVSLGPSIGPPVTISLPVSNECGRLAPDGGG